MHQKESTSIILTDHEHDHIRALADFKAKYPNINVISSEKEKTYIAGKKRSPRLIPAGALQKMLPEAQKDFGNKFISLLNCVRSVSVDSLVTPR